MDPTTVTAVAVITAAVAAVARGADVRLALGAAALALGGLAGDVTPVVREFLATFSGEKFVVPICTAMGFAHVLRHTGCDRDLVRVLVGPVRRARWLMVPGVVLAGFLVNVPVISQTSTAVCLAAVVVPLMRAAGFPAATIGASLLLGASVGGELLNPGAPELLTVSARTGVPTRDMWRAVLPLVLTVVAVSTLVLWVTAARTAGEAAPAAAEAPASDGPVRPLRVLVPLVPLAVLFLSGPPLDLFAVPPGWVVPPLAGGETHPLYNTRLIGLAMLIGVGAAVAVAPRAAGGSVRAFCDGAGYAFTHVVTLIVAAACFGKGVEQVGLARHLGDLVAAAPGLLQPLAAAVPAAFALVSGSGMASTQSLYGFFHGPAEALGHDPVGVGALVSVGAAAGRTASPVAAVVLMCASLTGTRPTELVRRVGPALAAGLAVAVLLRALGVL